MEHKVCWVPASGVMAKGKGYIARASNGAGVATAFPSDFLRSKPNTEPLPLECTVEIIGSRL